MIAQLEAEICRRASRRAATRPSARARGASAEVLAARFDPLDRAVEVQRERGDDHILRVDADLDAEAAADLRRDDADGDLRHAAVCGAICLRTPCGFCVEVVTIKPPLSGSGWARTRARLHRYAGDALIDHPLLTTTSASAKAGRLAAAVRVQVKATLPGTLVVELRCVRRERGFHVHDGGERVVVDVDQIERVARDVAILATTTAIASPT